jgi:hypothetical protein
LKVFNLKKHQVCGKHQQRRSFSRVAGYQLPVAGCRPERSYASSLRRSVAARDFTELRASCWCCLEGLQFEEASSVRETPTTAIIQPGCRLPVTSYQLPVTGCRLPVATPGDHTLLRCVAASPREISRNSARVVGAPLKVFNLKKH